MGAGFSNDAGSPKEFLDCRIKLKIEDDEGGEGETFNVKAITITTNYQGVAAPNVPVVFCINGKPIDGDGNIMDKDALEDCIQETDGDGEAEIAIKDLEYNKQYTIKVYIKGLPNKKVERKIQKKDDTKKKGGKSIGELVVKKTRIGLEYTFFVSAWTGGEKNSLVGNAVIVISDPIVGEKELTTSKSGYLIHHVSLGETEEKRVVKVLAPTSSLPEQNIVLYNYELEKNRQKENSIPKDVSSPFDKEVKTTIEIITHPEKDNTFWNTQLGKEIKNEQTEGDRNECINK